MNIGGLVLANLVAGSKKSRSPNIDKFASSFFSVSCTSNPAHRFISSRERNRVQHCDTFDRHSGWQKSGGSEAWCKGGWTSRPPDLPHHVNLSFFALGQTKERGRRLIVALWRENGSTIFAYVYGTCCQRFPSDKLSLWSRHNRPVGNFTRENKPRGKNEIFLFETPFLRKSRVWIILHWVRMHVNLKGDYSTREIDPTDNL